MKFGEIKQQAPFTVIVEPTEDCNLGCDFCGLRGMREHGTTPFFFMSLETAERIASEVARAGWTSKVVFANHGEPTVNQKSKGDHRNLQALPPQRSSAYVHQRLRLQEGKGR